MHEAGRKTMSQQPLYCRKLYGSIGAAAGAGKGNRTPLASLEG